MKRLNKKDKAVLDNLDRLLAGEPLKEPHSYLEDKILQVLKSFEYTKEKRENEQKSISRLISDISHQIKTPLSALSLHLELAKDDSLSLEERIPELNECSKQTQKIQFLTEAVLKVARLETGLISVKRIDADVVLTIQSAVSTIRPRLIEKNLSLELIIPSSLVISHDPIWTKEAITNLLDNAIKYTKTGGITISLEKGAIYTRIDISDTGIGISPDDYTKIFERFYRSRSKDADFVEGTGLGLPIAREILRLQGGNITVSSGDRGSTFSAFLQNC